MKSTYLEQKETWGLNVDCFLIGMKIELIRFNVHQL